jgi:HEAT repeat protein
LRDQRRSEEPVIAALTKSAADTDMEVRFLSIDALGQAGAAARSSLPVLKSALTDQEKRVREEAALAIPKVDPNDTSYQAVLISAMREGDGRTLLAVGAMGADAAWAVPTLIALLSHASPQVRVLAARGMGRIGPAAAAGKPALEAAARDSNAAVKKAATDALARIAARPPTEAK